MGINTWCYLPLIYSTQCGWRSITDGINTNSISSIVTLAVYRQSTPCARKKITFEFRTIRMSAAWQLGERESTGLVENWTIRQMRSQFNFLRRHVCLNSLPKNWKYKEKERYPVRTWYHGKDISIFPHYYTLYIYCYTRTNIFSCSLGFLYTQQES